jgi:RNA polymerase-binding transcription factor DksA
VKPAAPAVKTPVAAQKTIPQTMSKKAEDKKPATKAVAAKPVAAGPKATAKNPKDIKIAPAKPVSIPKITTKTARKYQPDFTKSVLDQPKNDPGAPIVRYNDADLAEFRELIQRKLGAAKKELAYLQGLITRKDEMGGDESDNRYMTMEDGSLSMEREQLSQMASRQITFIDHLEKALMRIENKTYGICRVTSKLIDKARLRAVPHATLSIEAKMGQAK